MAFSTPWPSGTRPIALPLPLSSSLDPSRISRGLLQNNVYNKRGSFQDVQYSVVVVMRTFRGWALGNESYESIETQGRNSEEETQASSSQSVLVIGDLLRQVCMAKDSQEALSMIAHKCPGRGGVVSNQDCQTIITAALAQNNVHLAFSIFSAMRHNLLQKRLHTGSQYEEISHSYFQCWSWDQPDVSTYITLVRGLAASLRVSDAIQIIADISRVGVPPGDEVPFGKVVKCPNCVIALAVVQPQHGIQLVSCSNCRYQYELMSGNIVSIESESISMNISVLERGLRFLQITKQTLPAAVHSIVVRAPNGLARTHRFATESVDLPAQEGERVTVALAAPGYVGRGIGPFKLSPRTPGWRPGEPMCITNHLTGLQSQLLRAPPKSGSAASFDTSLIVPTLVLLATGDAATTFIDPTLPRLISIAAASTIVLGTAVNTLILPQLNQLPQKRVDAIAIRQQLLSQYDQLQCRLKELTKAAEEEVWILARMCQLENKIEVIGEPSYSARRSRVKRARESLDESLIAKLELIASYAKIASRIEIEVEMDTDVLAAESVTNAANIAEQIERLMELDDLEKLWQIQAEANDEVERLLRSEPVLPDSV